MFRIQPRRHVLSGYALGVGAALILGLAMASIRLVNAALEPTIEKTEKLIAPIDGLEAVNDMRSLRPLFTV